MKTMIILFVLFSSNLLFATVSVIHSLAELESSITELSSNALVLIDIGNTLLTPRDAVLHAKHRNWMKRWVLRHHPHTIQHLKSLFHDVLEQEPKAWRLVDERWPALIYQLQLKSVKVVAFTKVRSLERPFRGCRSVGLKHFGLALHNELPELGQGVLYEYVEGVIATEAPLKGPVLQEALTAMRFVPQEVVFIDDNIQQIESVDQTCTELGIPCRAFHYLAENPIPPLDPNVASRQLHILIEEKRWVTEEQVHMLSQQTVANPSL